MAWGDNEDFDFVDDARVIPEAFRENRRFSPGPQFANPPRDNGFWNKEDFERLFRWAVCDLEASDVEFEINSPPYIKFAGRWAMACQRILRETDIKTVVSLLSGNDTANTTVLGGEPIDVRYQVPLLRGVFRRFRCNITAKTQPSGIPAMSVVMRAIPWMLPTVKQVGVPREEVPKYLVERGLVCITGPMGSGKTTTLAAIIKLRREIRPYESIGTYENPIEFNYAACKGTGPLWQVEIPAGIPNMASAARNMARRSPNVIIIGESRDQDSFTAVMDAANMGCAMYTTLHANSVGDTIYRIINAMPVERQMAYMGTLVDFSRYLVHQRLLPGTPDPVDGRPRRVPVRETLNMTEDMKRELLNITHIPLVVCRMHEFVAEYGTTLLADATEKYEEGLLAESAFKVIQDEFEDRERQIAQTKGNY